AGCAVGPDFHQSEPPPVAGYLPSGRASTRPNPNVIRGQKLLYGSDITSRWWDLFGSTHLNGLIEEAVRLNPDLQAAEAAVRVAQANTLAQRGALFPQVGANWNT